MISKAIYEDRKSRNKNISIAWIDFQKASDSVPHSWVEKSIDLVEVNRKIVRFYNFLLEKWNNASSKNKAGRNVIAAHSDTKRNIPGRLSLLFFNTPLTYELNRVDCRYLVQGTGRKISHLLYMDDLKLPRRSEDDLQNEIELCKQLVKILI